LESRDRRPGWPAIRTHRTARVGFAVLSLILSATMVAQDEVTGVVLDDATGQPIEGARVHQQARPEAPVVITGADGRFTLPIGDPGSMAARISAALTYDADAPVQYETAALAASLGDDLTFRLTPIPVLEDPDYLPVAATNCGACHSEQWQQWQQSNHSRAGSNPLVRDLYSGDGTGTALSGEGYVFRDLHDPEDTGLCATCHSPNENPPDPGGVYFNEVSSVAGQEGVTCTSCHQLHVVNDNVEAVHLLGNAEFRFPLATRNGQSATHEHVWGPLDDVEFPRMRSAYSPTFSSSRFCASCHQYQNPETGAPGQETYTEWQASPAAADGVQCQTCHMPAAVMPGTIASVGAAVLRPASQRHDHSFPGVYSNRLGDPIDLALDYAIESGQLVVVSTVQSLVEGHRWPTGVDVRNAFVVVEAALDGAPLTRIDGDTVPDWASDEVPGLQAGDYGGFAGRGYAKVLEGRINGEGEVQSPVQFIDAEGVSSNTTIPPGQTDLGHYRFSLPADAAPGDQLELSARVIYRRAWRAIAVAKGWPDFDDDGEPWERLVDQVQIDRVLTEEDFIGIFADRFRDETRSP